MTPSAQAQLHLESLEVGAAPLIGRFLQRLQLAWLLGQHLPEKPGPQPDLPVQKVLLVLLYNLLLCRRPLYAIAQWLKRQVPEHLGLSPQQVTSINDDRLGRALDHLYDTDRASLLTALVCQAVKEFDIDLTEFHQDTTTVTFSGDYDNQPPPEITDRPARLTFGYNKDHRPDLKQLLLSLTISDDGAVPLHCKIYDGNTNDTQVHGDTWQFLVQLVGSAHFLYVADSKLCTKENMKMIADGNGRFLTVMPRTRSENEAFREQLSGDKVSWKEVHRQPNSRRRDGPEEIYSGAESEQVSEEGYRILWYRSSQKQQHDRQARTVRLREAQRRVKALRPRGRGEYFGSEEKARTAAEKVLAEEQVQKWMRVVIEERVEVQQRQAGRGRRGPNTKYKEVQRRTYHPDVEVDEEALVRESRCDGVFPLMTNDAELSVAEALGKYKYQPFVEKRHQQLKSVFGVRPMWLKAVHRVESLLWLYYVVELVQALIEREVRCRMSKRGQAKLGLYPEGRESCAPTAELVLGILEGHRRSRLLNAQGEELQRFHDEVPPAAQEVLELLGVDRRAYGLN